MSQWRCTVCETTFVAAPPNYPKKSPEEWQRDHDPHCKKKPTPKPRLGGGGGAGRAQMRVSWAEAKKQMAAADRWMELKQGYQNGKRFDRGLPPIKRTPPY